MNYKQNEPFSKLAYRLVQLSMLRNYHSQNTDLFFPTFCLSDHDYFRKFNRVLFKSVFIHRWHDIIIKNKVIMIKINQDIGATFMY